MSRTCLLTRSAVGLLAVGLACRAAAQNLTPVPQDKADQMAALIGDRLTARPAKARRVLVFWRCEGFVHGKALEYGNKAFELAAAQTKAFTVDLSNDYEALKPESLARYDAVVLNNTTGLKTQENRFLEPGLVAFVRSGKGLAVIHAGADNFNKAEQAAEMVGGRFWGHPWGGGGTWAFKLDEPGHPLNAAFGGKGLSAGDEIYQQQSPFYNRAKLRVLVSLDFADKATAEAQGQRRADGDYAVSWIRPYGKGRVFYTSFGHDDRTFLDKARLTHIFDGVQYALGDLKADDTPSGLSAADLARVKAATDLTVNEAFALLQDTFAHTGHAATDAANRAKVEALLSDPAATPYGKQAALRALLAVGVKNLPPVSACLAAPETRDWAAALLAGAPGPAADQALARALASADAPLRATLLGAAAIRRQAALAAPYAADKDPAVAAAALAALGRIGTEEALAALAKPAAPALEGVRQTALAACLGTLAESGSTKAAARAAKPLFADPKAPPALRAACARALLLADASFFAAGLKDASPMVRQTLIRSADGVAPKALAAALKDAAPADQAALVAKLAARDARACAPDVAALLGSEHEPVVVEALRALATLGTADTVPALLALAARDGAVGEAARNALTDFRAPGAGEALVALALKEPAQQTRVLALLGERAEAALLPKLEPFLKAESADVRKEAWKAFGKAADERAFAQGLAWLPLAQEPELNQAEAAVRAISKNVEPAARAAALLAAWPQAPTAARRVLAGLMVASAEPAFIAPLAGALADADRGLRETALRALADWPTLEPFVVLKGAVASQTDAGLKNTALRGAVKLATANAGAETRARLVELFKAAPDDRGRTSVADALFRSEGLELFAVLQGLFADPACGADAKRTYVAFFDTKIKGQATAAAAEIDPKKWKVNASHAGNDAGRAIDRNPDSRWSSNRGSEKGMWFTLDLGENTFVSEIVLDTEKSGGDTPNGYEVFTSGDGKSWAGPVAQGDGSSRGKTVIPLAAQTRHLKFVTTGGRPGLHWSIHEITAKAGLDQKKVDAIGQVANSVR